MVFGMSNYKAVVGNIVDSFFASNGNRRYRSMIGIYHPRFDDDDFSIHHLEEGVTLFYSGIDNYRKDMTRSFTFFGKQSQIERAKGRLERKLGIKLTKDKGRD